jgi:flagellar biosynthesis/type III secretory pathway M-ring protein FliF/YscJ
MNWHNLSNKKKANFLVLGAALVFLLFVLSIALLNSKNNALSQQLIEERALSNSLKILQSSRLKKLPSEWQVNF